METNIHLKGAMPGVLFSIMGAIYAFSSPTVPFVTRAIGQHNGITLGLILIACGCFTMGPLISLLPMSIYFRAAFCILGEIFVGCGCALAFVPTLPIMLDSAPRRKDGDITGPISGLWNWTMAIGQVIAPLVGSCIASSSGFVVLQIVSGLATFACAVQFFFLFEGKVTADIISEESRPLLEDEPSECTNEKVPELTLIKTKLIN